MNKPDSLSSKKLADNEELKKQLVDDGHKLMHYFDAFVIDVICLLGDPQN